MRILSSAFVLAMAVCADSALAINKCTGPDGKITFQDAPCAGQGERLQVKPASGPGPSGSAGSGAGDAQRLEKIVADSQRDRHRQALRDKWIPEAEVALSSHRTNCEKRQKDLASSQYEYRQNLYGKTHAAQMASEMAAAAAMCDTRDRELKDKLDVLDKECATLKCR